MRKIIAWLLRLCCFAIIGLAVYTIATCVMHMNDDHSKQAVLGAQPTQIQNTFQSAETPAPVELVDNSANENPTVVLSADGTATMNHSAVAVTASFSNIESSIRGNLKWYVNGELTDESENRLLVEGSMLTYNAKVDVENYEAETASVELVVEFGGKRASATTEFPVEKPDDGDYVTIQTEEIPVTCIQDCSIYYDDALQVDSGEIMSAGETGLLLGYHTNSMGLSALKLQFPDGSSGWVSARRNEITEENCTTDEDYTEEQKVDFVNSMGYDSKTEYLVWVSLYTQKVNVFKGYKGHWELEKCFDCASGVNESPTTTGVFKIQTLKERWDLGATYVEPVLVFNGGEAFTSQPYDVETDEIADDTIGKPASGGGVRLLEDDIAWMSENMLIDTMVVVY